MSNKVFKSIRQWADIISPYTKFYDTAKKMYLNLDKEKRREMMKEIRNKIESKRMGITDIKRNKV